MGKASPVAQRIMAEGTPAERARDREAILKEARKLAIETPTFPPEKLVYVRNLLTKALRGKMDREVFKQFVRLTNSYMEVEECESRARRIIGRMV